MSFKVICNECNEQEKLRDEYENSSSGNIEIVVTPYNRKIIIQCLGCGNQISST